MWALQSSSVWLPGIPNTVEIYAFKLYSSALYIASLKSLTVFPLFCLRLHSTLSSCVHAVVALLYPFSWQHTFIPVLPASMVDIVCCPTPFLVGLLSSSLPKLKELPVEEVSYALSQPSSFCFILDIWWSCFCFRPSFRFCSAFLSHYFTRDSYTCEDRQHSFPF